MYIISEKKSHRKFLGLKIFSMIFAVRPYNSITVAINLVNHIFVANLQYPCPFLC